MSNDALHWAWRAALASGPKFVLVALADHGADHSGEDWTCFPSIGRLVERTGLSHRAVQRHLKLLWREGWLSRERRRRADGSLGIYDITLHREDDLRAALKAERNQSVEPDMGEGEPDANLACGEAAEPDAKNDATTRQKRHSPHANLAGQEEPSEINHQKNPHQDAGAREPGDDGFEEGFAAYPPTGQARTDLPAARAAWALAVQGAGSSAGLLAAVRRYAAEDRDLAAGDFGAPKFEAWLSGMRWRVWLEAPPGAVPANGVRTAADPWAGVEGVEPVPDTVLAELIQRLGFAAARAALVGAVWDAAGGRLVAWSRTSAERLACRRGAATPVIARADFLAEQARSSSDGEAAALAPQA